MELAAMLLIGAGAGLIAGLVGLAGGVVVVPALTYLLGPQALYDAIVVSWFSVLFNSLAATFKQCRVRDAAQRWALIHGSKYFAAGAMAIAATIALAVTERKGIVTPALVATLQLALAVVMLWPIPKEVASRRDFKHYPVFDLLFGGCIGGVSTLIGVGGGTYTIAYFVYGAKQTFQDAIATANVIGAAIGTTAVLAYAFTLLLSERGSDAARSIPWLPLLAILAPGLLSAPIGVRLSRRMPTTALRRILILVLVVSAIRLLLTPA